MAKISLNRKPKRKYGDISASVIETIDGMTFTIDSLSGEGVYNVRYIVDLDGPSLWECSCPAFTVGGDEFCKHIRFAIAVISVGFVSTVFNKELPIDTSMTKALFDFGRSKLKENGSWPVLNAENTYEDMMDFLSQLLM